MVHQHGGDDVTCKPRIFYLTIIFQRSIFTEPEENSCFTQVNIRETEKQLSKFTEKEKQWIVLLLELYSQCDEYGEREPNSKPISVQETLCSPVSLY
jgi:hypothetical protein